MSARRTFDYERAREALNTPCPTCGRKPTQESVAKAFGVTPRSIGLAVGSYSRKPTPYVPGDPVGRVRAMTNAIGAPV